MKTNSTLTDPADQHLRMVMSSPAGLCDFDYDACPSPGCCDLCIEAGKRSAELHAKTETAG